MAFRPPNFSPVLPLSTGAAVSKTLAGVLQRFGDRKDREKQQRQELIAALELQSIKQQNANAFAQLQSKLNIREDQAQFDIEAPERAFKQTQLTSTETQKRLDRESREKIAGIRAKGTTTPDRVEQRAIRKEERKKLTTLANMDSNQLIDNLRATGKVEILDESGDKTGEKAFLTPEHEQQFNLNQNLLEMRKAGLNDADLERLGISTEEAIRQYDQLKRGVSFPTLRPGAPGKVKRVTQSPLSNSEIIKLMKAGLTLDQINNGIQTLKQRPEFAKRSDGFLLKLLLRELK